MSNKIEVDCWKGSGRMTQEQREKLIYLNGKLEGLTWGVEDVDINEGLMEVNSAIEELLKEDGKDEVQ